MWYWYVSMLVVVLEILYGWSGWSFCCLLIGILDGLINLYLVDEFVIIIFVCGCMWYSVLKMMVVLIMLVVSVLIGWVYEIVG